MALVLEVGSVTEQEDGSYTVQVIVRRQSDQKIVSKEKDFQAKNAAELKAKVKAHFEKLVSLERKMTSIKTASQIVMDEIMNEVTQ